MRPGSRWTPERLEAAAALWGQGASFTRIAEALGDGLTRNAVAGALDRAGLLGRFSKVEYEAKRARNPVAPPKADEDLRLSVLSKQHRGIALAELSSTTCRWPFGDPSEGPILFCGAEVPAGVAYCGCHARIARRPRRRPAWEPRKRVDENPLWIWPAHRSGTAENAPGASGAPARGTLRSTHAEIDP